MGTEWRPRRVRWPRKGCLRSRCQPVCGSFQTQGPSSRVGGGAPCPHSHRWVLEVEGCVCKGREWGLAGLGPGRPLTVRGQGPHPAARRPLPGLLGVFSEQTAFLQGFTRDPPRPQQEGDTQCPLLLKTQTKAQPLPHPPLGAQPGAQGSQGLDLSAPGSPTCLSALLPGPVGASGPPDSRPWAGCGRGEGAALENEGGKRGKHSPRAEEWGVSRLDPIVFFPVTLSFSY